MKLIVGLGNPGRKYEGTRHNVGFEVLDELARKFGSAPAREKFDGQLVEAHVRQHRVLLVWPQTFMNLSGRCVRAVMDFYKLEPASLLVICDDFHLPLGKLRFRPSGSAGGQKGLQSIIQVVGSVAPTGREPGRPPQGDGRQFCRLRLGVGPVPDRWDPADFVLSRFSRDEKTAIAQAIRDAAAGAACWVVEGIDACMNQYNGS